MIPKHMIFVALLRQNAVRVIHHSHNRTEGGFKVSSSITNPSSVVYHSEFSLESVGWRATMKVSISESEMSSQDLINAGLGVVKITNVSTKMVSLLNGKPAYLVRLEDGGVCTWFTSPVEMQQHINGNLLEWLCDNQFVHNAQVKIGSYLITPYVHTEVE